MLILGIKELNLYNVRKRTSVNPLLDALELFLASLDAAAFFFPAVRYWLSLSAFARANKMNNVW